MLASEGNYSCQILDVPECHADEVSIFFPLHADVIFSIISYVLQWHRWLKSFKDPLLCKVSTIADDDWHHKGPQ